MRIRGLFRAADIAEIERVAAEILAEIEVGAVAERGGTFGDGAVSGGMSRMPSPAGGADFGGAFGRAGRFSAVRGFVAGGAGFGGVGEGGRPGTVAPTGAGREDGAGRFGLRKAGMRRFSGLGDVDDLIEESDLGVLAAAQEMGQSLLPERLSEVFSRDARRYDGGFERY